MAIRQEQFHYNDEDIGIENDELLSYAVEIVSAYVSRHNISTEDVPSLIRSVYASLEGLSSRVMTGSATTQPAVSIENSIHNDYIVCLEDGRKLKMLKRHLKAAYGMTSEQYRARWGLPANYPMVAPGYARKRSDVSRDLWQNRKKSSR